MLKSKTQRSDVATQAVQLENGSPIELAAPQVVSVGSTRGLRTLEKAGHCQCCLGEYRLLAEPTGDAVPFIAKHGYKREYGMERGECFGANARPWEIATDAAQSLRVALIKMLERRREQLHRLETGAVTTLDEKESVWNEEQRSYVETTVTLTPADGYKFTRVLQRCIRELSADIRHIERDLHELTVRLVTWKPAALQFPKDKLRAQAREAEMVFLATAVRTMVEPVVAAGAARPDWSVVICTPRSRSSWSRDYLGPDGAWVGTRGEAKRFTREQAAQLLQTYKVALFRCQPWSIDPNGKVTT